MGIVYVWYISSIVMTSLDNEADFYVDAYSAYKVASTLFRTKNVYKT